MTKKQTRKLATISFNNNNLNIKTVNRIVKQLNRSELKSYIKALKEYEKSITVTLITPKIVNKTPLLKEMKKLFPEKNIQFKEDKSLIGGIKIVDNDVIYESNIKNRLENLVSFINQ